MLSITYGKTTISEISRCGCFQHDFDKKVSWNSLPWTIFYHNFNSCVIWTLWAVTFCKYASTEPILLINWNLTFFNNSCTNKFTIVLWKIDSIIFLLYLNFTEPLRWHFWAIRRTVLSHGFQIQLTANFRNFLWKFGS